MQEKGKSANFKNLIEKFKSGSIATKLSFFLPGVGQILRKQLRGLQ